MQMTYWKILKAYDKKSDTRKSSTKMYKIIVICTK